VNPKALRSARFPPDLVRRRIDLLPGCAANWEFKVRIFAWKIPEQFQPRGHEPRASILVRVFESRQSMDAASFQLRKRWTSRDRSRKSFYDGMVVATPRRGKRGLSLKKPFAEMFLFRPALCPEIIAHESIHAASAYLRALRWVTGKKRMDLSLGPCAGFAREERLAYLAGYFAGEIQGALAQHRIWRRP